MFEIMLREMLLKFIREDAEFREEIGNLRTEQVQHFVKECVAIEMANLRDEIHDNLQSNKETFEDFVNNLIELRIENLTVDVTLS
jgi:hypothetical protein